MMKISTHIGKEANKMAQTLELWLPRWLTGKKNPPAVQETGLIPGSGRPPAEGNGNTLQYSCLWNPMDRGAWWATIDGVAELDMTE